MTQELYSNPPLVGAPECDLLKARIAQAARGEAFILLGAGATVRPGSSGTGSDAAADAVRAKLKSLIQAATLLTYAFSVPVVKIGCFESGDEQQGPDAQWMDRTYRSACVTLNLVRALTAGGYANLRQVQQWNREFVACTPSAARYGPLVDEIGRALSFIGACGAKPENHRAAEFFSSREALLLDYESALTRVDPPTGRAHDTAAHFVSIAGHAHELDGPHPAFLAGVDNPVGIRLGGDSPVDGVLACLDRLAPTREPGRLTLIARMGPQAVRDKLPALIGKVTAEGHCVAWACDPQRHDADGRLRPDRALDEVEGFLDVHRELGTHASGIRVELDGSWPLDLAFHLTDRLRAARRPEERRQFDVVPAG